MAGDLLGQDGRIVGQNWGMSRRGNKERGIYPREKSLFSDLPRRTSFFELAWFLQGILKKEGKRLD